MMCMMSRLCMVCRKPSFRVIMQTMQIMQNDQTMQGIEIMQTMQNVQTMQGIETMQTMHFMQRRGPAEKQGPALSPSGGRGVCLRYSWRSKKRTAASSTRLRKPK